MISKCDYGESWSLKTETPSSTNVINRLTSLWLSYRGYILWGERNTSIPHLSKNSVHGFYLFVVVFFSIHLYINVTNITFKTVKDLILTDIKLKLSLLTEKHKICICKSDFVCVCVCVCVCVYVSLCSDTLSC